MSIEDTSEFVPDYDKECENCGQTPTVKLISDTPGNTVHFDMCGPCTFGTAEALDVDTWNE